MAELVAAVAARLGDAPALIDEDGATTWRQLDARVNQLVHALRALGIGSGSVVPVMSRNRREWLEVQLAALHAGVVTVPVNWHFLAEELAYVLTDSGAELLVVSDEFAEVAERALRGTRLASVVLGDASALPGGFAYETWLGAGSTAEPDDQTAAWPLFYTSGTTGVPKGVRSEPVARSTVAIGASAAGLVAGVGYPAHGTVLLTGPIYHTAQWVFSVFPLLAGTTVVTTRGFDAAETLRAIDAHRVTGIHLVPTQFVRMLRLPDEVRAAFGGSSLVRALHTGAPCPIPVKERMLDWWGPVITEYYGGTEAGLMAMIDAEEWRARPGSVGCPLPDVEVAIVAADDPAGTPLPAGQTGEIWIRDRDGTGFSYHNDPAKTANAHGPGGFFRTGDIGKLDDDGYLYLVDRRVDMIISGGVNIYPAEVEGALHGHPAVADVAVVGVPDPEYGEQVKAVVEPASGWAPTPEVAAELIAHCRAQLAGYKAPRSVDFVTALPRSEAGKVLKRRLRDQYRAAGATDQ